jgi:hypothetical protein
MIDHSEFLLAKPEREGKEWSNLSFASAMRSMEAEPALYTFAEINVKYT